MALLSEADVCLGLENGKPLVDEMPHRAVQLLGYFGTVYIGAQGSCPHSTWNVHLQIHQWEHGMTHLSEGWNNQFSRWVGHLRPSIWNCIAALQKDELASRDIITQYDLGEEEIRQHSSLYSLHTRTPDSRKCCKVRPISDNASGQLSQAIQSTLKT